MATVVTVHGTYAHIVGPPNAPAPAELQWWQPGSRCEEQIRQRVHAEDGRLDFKAFTWSGDNSERARRTAGSKLLRALRQLEERKENYCLIGHSHGGSVIAAALVESMARGRPLEGLKRWITVGTPFVALRKERFLFTRLTLPRQVLLVASLMLLMMFLFYLGSEIYDGSLLGRRESQLSRFAISAGMMSLPFVVLYTFLKILDARGSFAYRPKLIERARARYAEKWLPLWHEDDEAVQGLRLLPRVKLHFFGKDFAAPTLTFAAIFALPLAYLFVVTSPPLMVGLANLLKSRLYDVEQYKQAAGPVDAAQQQMRNLRRKMQDARTVAETSGLDPARAEAARQEVDAYRKELRDLRAKLLQAYPELPQIVRAQRFKRRFLEENGKPCEGGTLCGGGRKYALNSKLLFHVVTDELASAFVDENWRSGPFGGILRLVLPIVLVPIVFALLALAILMVVQFIAARVSAVLSRSLNRMTHHQITRQALGNDTDGEIALGADSRPAWLPLAYPSLPIEVGDKISDYSNQNSFQSLAKFRNAISTLAFSESEEEGGGIITTYLTWRELIHTSYFEVPELLTLLAFAVGQADGFAAGEAFKSDPDFDRAARWHGALRPQPVA
jgi:hypothetical protein